MNRFAGKTMSRAGVGSRGCLKILAGVGSFARAQCDEARYAAAVIGTVLCAGVQPRYWARPVRTAFARQILAIGVEPLGFVCAVAVFVGISVVVQLTFWAGQAGQSQLLGPLLVAVVAREARPGADQPRGDRPQRQRDDDRTGSPQNQRGSPRAGSAGKRSVPATGDAARAGHGGVHVLPDDCFYPGRLCQRLPVRGLDGERQP